MLNKIKENDFFKMLDAVDKMNVQSKYFPTVSELKEAGVENNIPKYAPYLYYLSEDPLDNESQAYKETVKYCRALLTTKVNIV